MDKTNIWKCYQQVLTESTLKYADDNNDSELSSDEMLALGDAIETFVTEKAGSTSFDDPQLVEAHEQSTIGEFMKWLGVEDNQHHINILGKITSAINDDSIPYEDTIDVLRVFNVIMPDFVLAYRKIDKQTPVNSIKLYKLKGYIMTDGTKIP